MDEIRIQGLEVYAYHGVLEEEREQGQVFYVNAVLYLSLRDAAMLDQLSSTVNYGEVCEQIQKWMTKERFDLIESVAEKIAEELLMKYALIEKVQVEVEKPNAPISLPFRNVSVCITRQWEEVIIATGANMGNPEEQIQRAIGNLKNDPRIHVLRESVLFHSKPYGGVEQTDFINGAVKLKTLYAPLELLHRLKKEEVLAGRKTGIVWGPRPLDLDILFYADLVMETEELTIPHIDMENRDFVLLPVSQIAPNKKHPITQQTASQMLQELTKQYVITQNI